MNTHNIYFYGEIKKIIIIWFEKKVTYLELYFNMSQPKTKSTITPYSPAKTWVRLRTCSQIRVFTGGLSLLLPSGYPKRER